MPKRQTIKVATVLEFANRRLKEPDGHYSNPEYRRGIASLLEAVLHETGNYEGFQYHEWTNGGYAQWEAAGKPVGPGVMAQFIGDETRRVYFASPGPRAPKGGATVSRDFPMALTPPRKE